MYIVHRDLTLIVPERQKSQKRLDSTTYTTSCVVFSSSLPQSVSERQRDGPGRWIGATVVCEWGEKRKKVVPWVLFGWEEHMFEFERVLLYATAVREKWLQQFALWANSYLQSNHRKNEQSVTPLTSEVHHPPARADADHARHRFPAVWQLSLRLLSQRESAACTESLSWYFPHSERTRHAWDVYKSNESGNALLLL